MVGGALVVGTVQQPALIESQVALEMQQRVGGRHQSTGEEMTAHPVVAALGLERVHQRAMGEDVHEQRAVGLQPLRDVRQQSLVIAHMFEHFHRDTAIEACRGQLKLVDVAGQYLDVVQAPGLALRHDVLALAVRVGHRSDVGLPIAFGHPQGQRTPATAQFENLLAVGKSGALAIQFQHRFLSLVQRFAPGRVVAAAVLQPLAQAGLEERRGNFVVLAVGRVGMQCERTVGQFCDATAEACGLCLDTSRRFLVQALRAQAPDAGTQRRIGNQPAFGPGDQPGFRIFSRIQ
ncbi:hypothetical protein GPNADHDJ_01383 [Stenotrophomonas maltophilia]|uniref:Uncharacterized protein n=1 Tax=Stenotrophomonas maltophilia TaxID=40324 RepID=A0AAX1IB50_STEMA|nr:hypothetical protein GPNADHDJ_01383 [Stenotrophomonas maltophilia]